MTRFGTRALDLENGDRTDRLAFMRQVESLVDLIRFLIRPLLSRRTGPASLSLRLMETEGGL